MNARAAAAAVAAVLAASLPARAAERTGSHHDLPRRFETNVRPLLESHCLACHSGEDPAGRFDLGAYTSLASVVRDHDQWALVAERLRAREMPPADADQPTDAEREQLVGWIDDMRRAEARKNAGDPGVVLARRLSNAEYDYSIRDLTGVDIRPAREFPVDPANLAGFDNSGESLAMSAPLLAKYLQAAREVANHLVLKPEGIAFAPHPMLVETDRDKYCVQRILRFYARHNTDYADYFEASWRYKHRAALGMPAVTLSRLAAQAKLSPRYLATVWRVLEAEPETVGPLAALKALWRKLPVPQPGQHDIAREGTADMRDFVVRLRSKTAFQYTAPSARGVDSQPLLMWRNRQYAAHRMKCDPRLLAEGEAAKDPQLRVPAGDRARYEAAFARFCAVFPDGFYVSERGRYFPDTTRDRGRLLSAGFHNSMGYFRDDQPLYELVLDAQGRQELDGLWRELDFVAAAAARTYVQYYLNDSGEVRGGSARPADQEILAAPAIAKVAENQLAKLRAGPHDDTAVEAVADHFRRVNETMRGLDALWKEAEPRHVAALAPFAEKAYRRPLSVEERADLDAFYRSLRDTAGLGHDEAMRDSVAAILMAPDFCYRIDLVPPGNGVRPLSDYALASRLSYFLWASLPDAELLKHAAAGTLRRPEVIAQQARRMLKDPRVRGLATEFGGHWLDFRRFEEHNAVDRETFQSWSGDLRQAMFEEPIRFLLDVFRENRSVLDFLYAPHTFVNPVLAQHYGMPALEGGPEWVRVADADRYGRGGLLPMSVFLTKNAPGLRTSPVKRGYWVVKQVLGEHIPPPPAVVPELPRDEAKADLPVREALARHREEKSCASCHARFDSYGLVFEGYGPMGERRSRDLAGRPVDDSAAFAGGITASGVAGLRAYLRGRRQDDFVDNLSRKMLSYALGRSPILSDEIAVQSMRARLARNGYRIGTLIESIVTSPQFLNKRSVKDAELAQR